MIITAKQFNQKYACTLCLLFYIVFYKTKINEMHKILLDYVLIY